MHLLRRLLVGMRLYAKRFLNRQNLEQKGYIAIAGIKISNHVVANEGWVISEMLCETCSRRL